MEDFAELFISLIIGVVIFLTNILGGKKEQNPNNQPNNQPSPFFEEEDEPSEKPVSLDDIFAELRRSKERAMTGTPSEEEDDYIPRAPKPLSPQTAQATQSFLVKEQKKSRPMPTPQVEGVSVFNQTVPPIASEEINDLNESAFDIEEIDWRQTVVASEILNRKYT